jgi:hypothetical protein
MKKYSVDAQFFFEAKTNWEAQRKAQEIMREKGLKRVSLFKHLKNSVHLVYSISEPQTAK